jgi:hypothetical protein
MRAISSTAAVGVDANADGDDDDDDAARVAAQWTDPFAAYAAGLYVTSATECVDRVCVRVLTCRVETT